MGEMFWSQIHNMCKYQYGLLFDFSVVNRADCHLTAGVVICCNARNLLFTIVVCCIDDAKVKQEVGQLLFALQYTCFTLI